mmetsp:Transcript_10755/g.14951  ORF Transcript_10755/g.14951 Transcript_10755/m.14951 type:complete len:559 (-) Transcript_10755:165-1841(-)
MQNNDGNANAFPSLPSASSEAKKTSARVSSAWGNKGKVSAISNALLKAERGKDGSTQMEDVSAQKKRQIDIESMKKKLMLEEKEGSRDEEAESNSSKRREEGEVQKVLILDSGAFITGSNIASRYGPSYRYVTIQDVVDEIKDERSRQTLESFPFKIELLTVEKESLNAVQTFSKLSGDLRFLSRPDIRVLALTYQLEAALNGTSHIRKRPNTNLQVQTTAMNSPSTSSSSSKATSTINSNRVSSFALRAREERGGQDAIFLSVSSLLFDDEEKIKPRPQQKIEMRIDSSNDEVTGGGRTTGPDNNDQKSEEKEMENSSSHKGHENDDDDDDEDDDGEWITPENVGEREFELVPMADQGKNLANATTDNNSSKDNKLKQSEVSCITTDFTMQNVILQMGLRLTSVDGRRIRSVRRWQLQCYSCYANIVDDLSRQFCHNCGNPTLARVSVSVDDKGVVRYWRSKREITTRGKKYPIPLPKGGRGNQDLILREDVMKQKNPEWSRAKQGKDDASFDSAAAGAFAWTTRGPPKTWVNRTVVGYGRKNPNKVKKSGRRRKKH